MTVLTPYQQLEDAREILMRGGGGVGSTVTLNTLDDVLLLIKHAAQAATLCACPVPRQGVCNGCLLAQDLRNLGVPKLL